MAAKIVLTTLNSRYQHTAFGLRYLFANLEELRPDARILEFTLAQNPRDIAERILEQEPEIVGIGVYIWNTRQCHELVSILKKVAPEVRVVLGGPEVSHETETQAICALADFVIRGEADFLFREFCRACLSGARLPEGKWISGELPDIKKVASPYPYYSDEDVRNRVIYVEASRGCPYKCEYCLSSLDKTVRSFDLDAFLVDMDRLIERGARQFKFIDRTFNLSVPTCTRILQFFLDRVGHGLFLHFEMVPDRLPVELRELIRRFPAGALQFVLLFISWNPEVARLVSRRQDYSKIRENFRFLSGETGVHVHADLIVGLPGETLESFARGFDEMASLGPHEIQVGMLKRLKGTPIARHDREWEMVYQEHAPFQVLSTRALSFAQTQLMDRFARFWDLYANSGNFYHTMRLLRARALMRADRSLFWLFMEFSVFLAERHPQGHGVALLSLVESAWVFLTQRLLVSEEEARSVLIEDYSVRGKRDVPRFLRGDRPDGLSRAATKPPTEAVAIEPQGSTPARQMRHLAAKADAKKTVPCGSSSSAER